MSPHPRAKRSRTSFLPLALVAIAALLGLLASTLSPATAGSATTSRRSESREAHARQVLARAQALFAPTSAATARARLSSGRDATLALRDLAEVRGDLSPADRVAADRLSARPGSSVSHCNSKICVHWKPAQVKATDTNGNGVADYIDQVLKTVTHVNATYVSAGYRSPEKDGTRGGDARTDIYIDDIGNQGLYGYCTTDQKSWPTSGPFDSWAFCVLDNDYSKSEFPTNTPIENMEVTAAHEYFHAVQFAYDYFEDRWFMEATATWAEDELYDNVDDNLQYLFTSPISQPDVSMDAFGDDGRQYGDWIFFRYLTENLSKAKGGMPTLIRDIWDQADGAAGGPDEYSLQAIATVLAQRGTTLADEFTSFADANRRPSKTYDEGKRNKYPVAPLWDDITLTPAKNATAWAKLKLDHLTSATAQFVPSPKLKEKSWLLDLDLDLADTSRGSTAIATVYLTSGKTQTSLITLNKRGKATATLPFSAKKVTYVELTVVNASERYDCWRNTPYSCQGKAKDDNQVEKFRGIAHR